MGTTDPSHFLEGATNAVQKQIQAISTRLKSVVTRLPAIRDWLIVSAPPMSVIPDAVPFQGEIEQLLAETPPRILMSTFYLLLGLFASILLITSLVQVDVVISGTGRLSTATPPMTIQPLDKAIVRTVKVRVGDFVTKGQVVASLDPTFTMADLTSLQSQKQTLVAQIHRLDAELAGKQFVVNVSANLDEQLQANLYHQQVAQYNSRVRTFDEDINRNTASIKTTEADRTLLIKQLSVAQDVENTRSNLLESRTGTKLQYLESQAGRVRAERDLADTVNRLVELQHGVQSLRAQRQAYIDDWNRQLLEELSKSRGELARIDENINKAARMQSLVDLTAPEDGVVTEVAKRAEGAVLNGGEPLVTMVPAHTPLIAEIAITSGDVGYVKIGDYTQIKVDAFPFQRYGRLRGHLASISQESFGGGQKEDQRASMGFSETSTIAGGAVHKVRIELEDQTLQHLPEGVQLIPGMTLLAEIKVGTRSIISYFLNPITRGLGESVKEP